MKAPSHRPARFPWGNIWAKAVLLVYRLKAAVFWARRFFVRLVSVSETLLPTKPKSPPLTPANRGAGELLRLISRCIGCSACNLSCSKSEPSLLPDLVFDRSPDEENLEMKSAWLACFHCEGCIASCPFGVPLQELSEMLRAAKL